MNTFPIIEMLAFFNRFYRREQPDWNPDFLHQLKRVRSCHTRVQGGITTSYYSVETKSGDVFELSFDQEELIWELQGKEAGEGLVVDRMLAHMQRHKHLPSDAHRIVPVRFEVLPVERLDRVSPIDRALINRIRPFRFQRTKHGSVQVRRIETRHLENKITEKNLNYVVEDTDGRFYHIVFIPDLLDWRFMQEVDEQFLFVRG